MFKAHGFSSIWIFPRGKKNPSAAKQVTARLCYFIVDQNVHYGNVPRIYNIPTVDLVQKLPCCLHIVDANIQGCTIYRIDLDIFRGGDRRYESTHAEVVT